MTADLDDGIRFSKSKPLVQSIIKYRTYLFSSNNIPTWHAHTLYCEPKKTPKCFCHILHKTRPILMCVLSWVNLQYSSVNVFYINWTIHDNLWNLAFAFCKWTGSWNKRKFFLLHRPQNQVDSDKILYIISWIYLPQSSINVFHLTWVLWLHYLVKLKMWKF